MTTFTNPHSLPLIEPATDKVKDSTEPSALAGDINALAASVNSALGQVKSDVITDATTKYGGLPARVTAVESKNLAQDTAIAAAHWFRGAVPASTDWNTFDGSGLYFMTSAADLATMTNMPPGASTGWGEFWRSTTGSLKEQTWTNYGSTPRSWFRTTASTTLGTFSAWQESATVPMITAAVAALDAKNTAQDLAITNASAEAKAYTDTVAQTSHLAADTDGTPYFSPGSMTLRVFTDTDGNPFFLDA